MGNWGKRTDLLDYGQHPGLRIVASVGSNAQIDLVGALVAAKGSSQTKERVLWSLRDRLGVEGSGSHWGDVLGDLR